MSGIQEWVVNGYSERWLRKGLPVHRLAHAPKGTSLRGGRQRLHTAGPAMASGVHGCAELRDVHAGVDALCDFWYPNRILQ